MDGVKFVVIFKSLILINLINFNFNFGWGRHSGGGIMEAV